MGNVIDKYRRIHKHLRTKLNPYTQELCPNCPNPCCMKPAKVNEFDVLIANACGCSFQSANDSVSNMIDSGFKKLRGEDDHSLELEPCDYLGEKGCLFPDDLRPYECARFICHRLRNAFSPADMRDIRDLLRKLRIAYYELKDAVVPRGK